MYLPVAVDSPPLLYPDNLTLSPKAKTLFELLVSVARKVSDFRGYCGAVTQVHFFCPAEVVAFILGFARSTLYLKIRELEAAELIHARAHYVTHKGQTRADGTVWAVKLYPDRPSRLRVPHDALKVSYRCLSADIEVGRTAWNKIGQSKELQNQQDKTREILSWALPPQLTQNPVTLLTVRCDLEQVLDLPYVGREQRSEAVDAAARTLAAGLGDANGLMFYRWLLWQLLRLSDAQGSDYWHQVYEQARRARSDAAEGFAKKPGALFVSRLKDTLWWDGMVRQPQVRVGGTVININ